MLNVPLKKQFRSGKDTLVVTAYTKELRAYLYNKAIYISGAGEPFKIANLTDEFDIAWVSNEYQIANTVERELRSMVAMYLDNQVPVSTQKEVTPIWVWFDGAEYVLSKTKPTDFMAIQAGYAPAPDNGKPLVLTKFASAFTLVRDSGKYAVESNHTHAAQYRSSSWVIPDEELREQVEYALDADLRKAKAAEKEKQDHIDLLAAHTNEFDVSDDRNYGKPDFWGNVLFTDGTTRFVKVRRNRNRNSYMVTAEVLNATVPNEVCGVIHITREGRWEFSPSGIHHPELGGFSQIVGADVSLVSRFQAVDIDGLAMDARVDRVQPELLVITAFTSDSVRGGTYQRLVGTIEKQDGVWVYFHMFGSPLSSDSLSHVVGNESVVTSSYGYRMRHLASVRGKSSDITLRSIAQEGMALTITQVHSNDFLITHDNNKGSQLVGVIVNTGKHYPGHQATFVYYPRSELHFDINELSYLLGVPVTQSQPTPATGYRATYEPNRGSAHRSAPDTGYRAASAYSLDCASGIKPLGGSRFSEMVVGVAGESVRVRFLGSTKSELAHCLFVETNNLLIEENGRFRKFNGSARDAAAFMWLVSNLGTQASLCIYDSWIPDAVVNVKHFADQTHITITKSQYGRTVSTTITAPYGTYTDVATYVSNL